MNVAQETLGLRRQGFSPCLTLLMSAFALPMPPEDLTILLRRRTERSPTTCACAQIRSFGRWLEPRYIFRAGRLDQ
jgi:hypothetical protein